MSRQMSLTGLSPGCFIQARWLLSGCQNQRTKLFLSSLKFDPLEVVYSCSESETDNHLDRQEENNADSAAF